MMTTRCNQHGKQGWDQGRARVYQVHVDVGEGHPQVACSEGGGAVQ